MRNLDNYSKKYEAHPFEDLQVEYRKKNMLELLQNLKHKTILEVGCGLEPFFSCFDDFDKLIIVEPSVIFYENAKKIVENDLHLKSRVVLINEYIENVLAELSSFNFDIVLISGLLHEIQNGDLILENLRKILRPDTVVHANVPNANSFHRLLAFEMGLIDSVFQMSGTNIQLQQQNVYDLNSLSELVQKQGYKIISSGSYFVKPFTHKQMSEMIDNKIIDEKVLDGLFKMIKYMPGLGSEIYVNFILND